MFDILKEPAAGLKLLLPKVHGDERGYFFESYSALKFADLGMEFQFIQDNQAKSSFGVVRGLHFQRGVKAQTKLVRALQGEVLDVVVDLRPGSKTQGQSFSFKLSAENQHMLIVPKGFAHGYSTLSKEAIFVYKCDEYYSPEHEAGLIYNDPELKIDWGISKEKMIISNRDTKWPQLSGLEL